MSKKAVPNSALAALLVAAIVISVAGVAVSATSTHGPSRLRATSFQSANPNASVQLSLQQVASLTFAISSINWGTGAINTSLGNFQCILDTEGSNVLSKCSNFTTVTQGFVLENDGTINLTIDLVSNKNRTQFIGGNDDDNAFKWRISNNETGSCGNITGPTTYAEVNTTAPGTRICHNLFGQASSGMNFLDNIDTMKIDINITIPTTASAGLKTATITATGTAT